MNKELFIYLMRNKPNIGNFIKPTVHNLALFLSNTNEHFLNVFFF